MNKKILFAIFGVVIIAAVAVVLYLFVLSPAEPKEVYAYYPTGDPFIINISESRSLFKTTVVLVINSDKPKLTDQLDIQKPLIRDTINFYLRTLNIDELESPEIQERLRTEIAAAINESVELEGFEAPVTSVLFTEFFVQ